MKKTLTLLTLFLTTLLAALLSPAGAREQITLSVQGKTQLLAKKDGRQVWRFAAQRPLTLVGQSQGVVIGREGLGQSGGGTDARLTGLDAGTGKRLWQATFKGLAPTTAELYARALLLYQPSGTYATGNTLIVDVRTGKTILIGAAPAKSKTAQEILFVNPPGPPPYQNGVTLSVIRLDPNTLKNQSLSLPLPHPAGVSFDESPTRDVRVTGDVIEALYAGYRGKPGPSSPPAYLVARYSFGAGVGQQPQITLLDTPQWPAPDAGNSSAGQGATVQPPTITGILLQPVELRGQKLPNYPGTRKPYLLLSKDGTVSVFGGVHSYRGTYTLPDTYHFAGTGMTGVAFALRISALIPTNKALGTPADQAAEKRLLSVLTDTRGYRGDGSLIALLSGDQVIARFQPINDTEGQNSK